MAEKSEEGKEIRRLEKVVSEPRAANKAERKEASRKEDVAAEQVTRLRLELVEAETKFRDEQYAEGKKEIRLRFARRRSKLRRRGSSGDVSSNESRKKSSR